MRTKPKCIKDIEKLLNKQQVDTTSSSHSIYQVTDKLSSSFVSLNSDELTLNDNAYEYKEFRCRVRVYINIFKDHVFDKDHPMNMISVHFVKLFTKYVEDNIKELYVLKNSNSPDFYERSYNVTEEIVKALRKFIIKLQTALRLMYSKTINYQCFIEEKDEFINLVTNLIMKQGRLYDKLYELFEINLYNNIQALNEKISTMKNVKPEDLGINEIFCLNDVTLKYQKKLMEEKKDIPFA
jgi:hypothetical protein